MSGDVRGYSVKHHEAFLDARAVETFVDYRKRLWFLAAVIALIDVSLIVRASFLAGARTTRSA